MTTAAEISRRRGKEIFLVETVKTPKGKKYAIVSHRETIGQDKRIIEMFEYTPLGREKATRIAKQFRKESEVTNQ